MNHSTNVSHQGTPADWPIHCQYLAVHLRIRCSRRTCARPVFVKWCDAAILTARGNSSEASLARSSGQNENPREGCVTRFWRGLKSLRDNSVCSLVAIREVDICGVVTFD